ncbi:13923_t:CDS:2, partial [Acaulospora colombiana]
NTLASTVAAVYSGTDSSNLQFSTWRTEERYCCSLASVFRPIFLGIQMERISTPISNKYLNPRSDSLCRLLGTQLHLPMFDYTSAERKWSFFPLS